MCVDISDESPNDVQKAEWNRCKLLYFREQRENRYLKDNILIVITSYYIEIFYVSKLVRKLSKERAQS